ncbi:MAG TPA: hypothetical protein VEQ59_15355 [Polyangiaceae bacterium]|nr:hypothetical protein [Polyangiaceae bacterium]
MLTPKLRFVLALASFALGGYRLISGDYAGLALLAASAFLAYGYFKYGTVWLAFRAVSGGKIDEAAELLQKVKRPGALGAQERAYYELASGFVCASRAQNDPAEQHLRAALQNQLRTENDRALAEAILAQLLVARDALGEARTVLEVAKTRACRSAIAARIQALYDDLPPTG